MAYQLKAIQKMLVHKLGMEVKERDHTWFVLKIEGMPAIKTKLSHHDETAGKELEKRIYQQLHVRKPFFHELMDCTKSRDDFIEQVRSDPYPTFDQLFL